MVFDHHFPHILTVHSPFNRILPPTGTALFWCSLKGYDEPAWAHPHSLRPPHAHLHSTLSNVKHDTEPCVFRHQLQWQKIKATIWMSFRIHSSSTIMEDEFRKSRVRLTKTITTKQTIPPKMYGLKRQTKVKGVCSIVLRTGVRSQHSHIGSHAFFMSKILGPHKDLTSSSYTCRGTHTNTHMHVFSWTHIE